MRPTVVVVSHTHWDREWHQPFERFRARLCTLVAELLDLLERDPDFRHFMLDGQTVCLDDVVAVRPSLAPRLRAAIAAGRLGVGPWYVLQDEFLVGGEAIVRNLAEGLAAARRWGRALPVGYLPDAFGHIAQMPRILRGFGIEAAVLWRGVGDKAPGNEWRWRGLDGSEVLCLFLPGGYGNAHRLGAVPGPALGRLEADLATGLPASRAALVLWMNGNDHQPPEPEVPALLAALRRARPDVDLEQASLERAVALVKRRVALEQLPQVEGELRRATRAAPLLAGVLSARSWQKRHHDEVQARLVRFAEPLVAFAGRDRQEALGHAWRTLLQCQPHDSICGCSVDEVHRDVAARLRHAGQAAEALVREAVEGLAGAPTADFALHEAIALVSPQPFATSLGAEVRLQRRVEDGPFVLRAPAGEEVPYTVVARTPTDGPDGRPAEWLTLRLRARALPPHGLRLLALERGQPAAPVPTASPLAVEAVPGGLAIVDRQSGLRVLHTFEDEGDRGDLYDFCPLAGEPPRRSPEHHLGLRLIDASVVGQRVELEVEIDNRRRDHRLRARFELTPPGAALLTDTPFGWLERQEPGTHPVSLVAQLGPFAVGGHGLHEVERGGDGALLLTLFRGVGWMSRGDLTTRHGHAGYSVATPEAEGLGRLRYRYVLGFGAEAAREVEAGVLGAVAVPLAYVPPAERPLLALEPAAVRLSICKRAEEGAALIVRLLGPPSGEVMAQLRLFVPVATAARSDLDERLGPPLAIAGDTISLPLLANEVVTLRIELGEQALRGV